MFNDNCCKLFHSGYTYCRNFSNFGEIMKIKILLAGLIFLTTSVANAIDFGIGAKAGTLGVGAELSVALTQTINARISLTKVSEDFDEEVVLDDAGNSATIDATMDLDFGATALLLDWYVFDGTFHVSAGMVKNDSKIDLQGVIRGNTVTFNGTPYNVSQDFADASITGTVSAGESFEPYLGIGWGRKADDDPGLSLSVEIGVVLMDPSVDLRGPTVSAANPNNISQAQLNADVDAAEQEANDDLSDLEAWPVLSIGLNYAF